MACCVARPLFFRLRGEPHHLKKYPNKLDYSIKMKEFFDHWLKGEDAPSWMTDGVPHLRKGKEDRKAVIS